MLTIRKLKIDYQENPVGIEEVPQFQWEIASDRRNVIQDVYKRQVWIQVFM